MVYSSCFSLGGILDFQESLQKKFYIINYRSLLRLFYGYILPQLTQSIEALPSVMAKNDWYKPLKHVFSAFIVPSSASPNKIYDSTY